MSSDSMEKGNLLCGNKWVCQHAIFCFLKTQVNRNCCCYCISDCVILRGFFIPGIHVLMICMLVLCMFILAWPVTIKRTLLWSWQLIWSVVRQGLVLHPVVPPSPLLGFLLCTVQLAYSTKLHLVSSLRVFPTCMAVAGSNLHPHLQAR